MIDNLVFEEGYFEGEEREGFFVESMMKRAWAAQLVVLQELDRICTKHGITYFADFGTLLGAVRHKGYVPWDDDMDIAMKRKDYQKFLKAVEKDAKEGYRVFTAERDADYFNVCARFVNSVEISFKKERLETFYQFPYVVGVDIFILDAVPRDEEERIVLNSVLAILFRAAGKYIDGEEPSEEDLCTIEEVLNVKIDRTGNIRQQILVWIDRVGQSYVEEEVDVISTTSGFANNIEYGLKKEWFRDVVYLPFENIMVPAPIEYEAVLEKEYGDYMTPVRTPSHEYPFYKKQEKILIEKFTVPAE